MMRIALDAMGGDYAPRATVAGGIMAAREYDVEVLLVGREEEIRRELKRFGQSDGRVSIIPATQVIEMDEKPALAVRAKPDSSVVVGVRLIKEGVAQAFVSMGNSGGTYAAALFHLGRISGVKRPALSTVFPTQRGPVFLLDVGANTDCKPEFLLQFAIMGSAYAERVLGIPNPRLGIISTGEEEGKGNTLVMETYPLLKNSGLNFVGNIEGKDLTAGLADVVVTDGFTGNVIIKLAEGVGSIITRVIAEEMRSGILSTLGGLLSRGAFQKVKARMDYSEYGGGALLGVNGVVIIGHGRSNARAVKNAIRVAKLAVEREVVEAIGQGIAVRPVDEEKEIENGSGRED